MKAEEILKKLEEFVLKQATELRSQWKRGLCDSEDIEKYGSNEFVGGKADAYEDCLDQIRALSENAQDLSYSQ